MLKVLVQTVAGAAALAAVLLGMHRGWELWPTLQRAILSYFVLSGVGALLGALGRLAISSEPQNEESDDAEGDRVGGTDAAV